MKINCLESTKKSVGTLNQFLRADLRNKPVRLNRSACSIKLLYNSKITLIKHINNNFCITIHPTLTPKGPFFF
ncbi:hypothetical protein BpHYR1_012295 [Brachionus plicatilis]|uniref:Uncharacterized protein n=1 Tax=Brachionus plicatilis TaxID=10195 RepID=A0A3M7RRF1_BRAPC|nr:hypothetical protein BpHYR1_012295 [Brachionus plicatilis]